MIRTNVFVLIGVIIALFRAHVKMLGEQIFAKVSEYFDTFSVFATIQTIPQYIVAVKFSYTICASSTEKSIKTGFSFLFLLMRKQKEEMKRIKKFLHLTKKKGFIFYP